MTQPVTPPIDAAELLDRIAAAIRRFVVASDAQLYVLALWIVHTHAIDAADSTPYLSIKSPEKRSGKSRLLEVLAKLVARPMEAANVSDPALFRALGGENGPMTLLFDEVDSIFGRHAKSNKEEQRGLLNAGWRRGADAWRCESTSGRHTVTPYPVFGAKALAGLGDLPETLADRSIPISLRRRRPDEKVERGRYRIIAAACEPLRQEAAQWAQENLEALRDMKPDLPEELSDRAQDGAEPLLAIADLAGKDWPERARSALVELHHDKPPEAESQGVRLLADVRAAIGVEDRIATAELLERLNSDEEAPWSDWNDSDKGLKARQLARILSQYGIRPSDLRTPDGVRKGYKRKDFEDAWQRYLPADPPPIRDKRDIGSVAGKIGGASSATKEELSRMADAHTAHSNGDVADVAEGSRVEADRGARAKGETP